jgi:hypothetical protein
MEKGYVYLPYLIMNSTAVYTESLSRNKMRIMKINNILNIENLDEIKSVNFLPRKSIKSRYSTKIVNCFNLSVQK